MVPFFIQQSALSITVTIVIVQPVILQTILKLFTLSIIKISLLLPEYSVIVFSPSDNIEPVTW
jgi:hypothetical protein